MRRAAVGSLATALTLSLGVTACRETAPCDNCGTLVTLVTSDADVLVPAFTQGSIGVQISDLLFLKLADLGLALNTLGDSGFQPRLARSWKFEDSLTIAFELDPRARWQDGVPVTASDVAFTFDVYRDPKAASPSRPLLTEIASVTARDERTAIFRFKHHYAEQFYDATHHMRVLPRHLLDSIPHERMAAHPFNRQPIGNGPYRFVSWRAGESVELGSDTAFFLGRPGLARLIWRITPSYPTAITQLVSGEADFLEYLGGPENVARVASAPEMRIIKYTSPGYVYLGLNLRDPERVSRPNPLFQDRELRRALSHAVDRQTIVDAVVGEYGKVALGPTSRMTAIGNDTTLPQLAYDTATARSMLDRLGWEDRDGDGIRERNGRKLEFEILVPNSSQIRQRMAVILQEQFKKVGVGASISVIELNLFGNRTRTGKFQAAMLSWNDDPTPSSIRQTWTSKAIGDANFVGYANPRFDRLVDEASFAPDPAAAVQKWRAVFSTVIEDAPGIWLTNLIQPAGIDKRYDNVTVRPDQWSATLWTWRIPPDRLTERDRAAAPREQ